MKEKRNQPKYNFFKNTSYAIKGLKDIIKNEKSFKIELCCLIIVLPFIYVLQIETIEKILLFISFTNILVAEIINSAIERIVDLVTTSYNSMAGRAKDIGSTIVFVSIIICIIVWVSILIKYI